MTKRPIHPTGRSAEGTTATDDYELIVVDLPGSDGRRR